MIQSCYNCKYYKPNKTNNNLTCQKNKKLKRCVLLDELTCYEYKEKVGI